MVRNTIISGLVLLSGMCGITAQPTLVTEFDFPERAVLRDMEFERFRYVVEDNWHIVSFIMQSKRQAIAYNAVTGETKSTNYAVDNVFDFNGEKRYVGWRTDMSSGSWNYLRLRSDGTFQPVSMLPASPLYVHEERAYGISNNQLYEMQPLTGENTVLFEFPEGIFTNHCDFHYEDGVLYIAHVNGLLSYHFDGDSLHTAYADYFAERSLELIPWSVLEGKFLFYEKDAVDAFIVHEMGHNMAPREIPSGANPPAINPAFWYTSNPFQGPRIRQGFHSLGIAHGPNVTWMAILDGDYNEIKTSYLFRIDRQAESEGVDEVGNYKRSIKSWHLSTDFVNGFENSREVVALGLYGDAGFEPYGIENGKLSVLKDFYEGPMGSVAYVNDNFLNMTTRFHRSAEYLGYRWFAVNSSHFGMELAISDGTPGGTRLLGDLEPGLAGIRAIDFDFAGGALYFMVQKQDHSIAIYQAGPDLPAEPELPKSNVDWEVLQSNMDGERTLPMWAADKSGPTIVHNGSQLAYMTNRLGENHNYLQLGLPEGTTGHMLVTMDTLSGDVIRRKSMNFHDYYVGDNRSYLLARKDGGYKIVRSGRPTYHEDDFSIELPYELWIDDGIFLVNMSADLEFESLKRLDFGEYPFERVVLAYSKNDGNIIVIAEHKFSFYGDFQLQIFNENGDVIKSASLPFLGVSQETCEAWVDENEKLYIAQYSTRANCENCTLLIHSFDGALQKTDTYEAHYNGRLGSPRMYMMDGGERWITGGLNGSISLPVNGATHTAIPAVATGWKAFVAREIVELNRHVSFTTYDAEILNYQPTFLHKGNVFLNYLRPEIGVEDFEPLQDFSSFFNPPDKVYYEIVQLDGLAREAAYNVMPLQVFRAERTFYHTQFIRPNGKWIRALSTGNNNVVHADFWKHPSPTYHDNFVNRLQMVQTDWPFVPLPMPELLSEADQTGSHLHIFPNPNNGSFYILPRDGANKIPYENLRIHDMQGRLVYARPMRQDFSYKEVQLPADLAKGVYHVVFSGPDVQESVRMVIAE